MSEHANRREKRLAMLVVAAVVLVTVLLIVETFRLLLPGLWSAFSAGDEQALSEYLASQGRLRSFLTLWFLAVVQVLSLVIPAMPVQLAAGLAYGPWMGFLTSFSASAVANMSVYLIARRLVPVIRRLVADNPKAAKLLDSVRSSKDPWFYTILAFITPGLPNGIIPYAAANAGMRPKQFLAAIFISLPFPTLLTCAAGSFMLEGNWLFTVLTGIVTTCPPYTAWDAFHIKECRLVILDGGELAGWAALRRVDPRWCYRGVAEVSIYVGEKFRGRGLGSRLLTALCEESEKEGYWTLHSTVLQDNTASLGLHTKCGFRVVGRRERIARDCHGRWLDTYLMERRTKADEPAGYKKL